MQAAQGPFMFVAKVDETDVVRMSRPEILRYRNCEMRGPAYTRIKSVRLA